MRGKGEGGQDRQREEKEGGRRKGRGGGEGEKEKEAGEKEKTKTTIGRNKVNNSNPQHWRTILPYYASDGDNPLTCLPPRLPPPPPAEEENRMCQLQLESTTFRPPPSDPLAGQGLGGMYTTDGLVGMYTVNKWLMRGLARLTG